MSKRKCSVKGCRNPAVYCTPVQCWCSDEHRDILVRQSLDKVRKNRDKEAKAKHKADKARVKTMAKLKAEAQQAVNEYVRARDAGKPCISCGRPDDGQHQRHAGHWKTVKARSDIRFNPDNIHAQCSQCNMYGGGGLHPGYLPELINRIGQGRVNILTICAVVHYTREQLEAIKAEFRQKTREIRKA